jgi:hypothetical protein
MKKLSIILILLLLNLLIILSKTSDAATLSNIEFFTPMEWKDWGLQVSFISLVLVDWDQTKRFRRDGHKEGNPIGKICLGETPSQERIDQCISMGILLHTGITYAAGDLRPVWQIISLILEWQAVMTNKSGGYEPHITILNIGATF